MPAGANVLPLSSNIQAISEFVYYRMDPNFHERAKDVAVGIVVGGESYGRGSSREHAALAPRFLGIRAKLAKSFARIYTANLVNFGILPLTFVNPEDYDSIEQDDTIRIEDLRATIEAGTADEVTAHLIAKGKTLPLSLNVTSRQRAGLLACGLINTAVAG